MRTFFICLLTGLLAISINGQKTIEYPNPPKGDVTNEYFGTPIEDPYQWMEEPNNADLIPWLEAQRKIIRKEKNRQTKMMTLREQMATLYHAVHKSEIKENVVDETIDVSEYKFRLHNNNASKSNNLEYKLRHKGNYKTLARSRTYKNSPDENIEFIVEATNEDEDLVAISVGRNGGDWREIYFYDLETGEKLEDELMHARLGTNVKWDGKNVYYDRYDKPKEGRELLDAAVGQKLYYHTLGTSQDQDKLIFENPVDNSLGSFRYKVFDEKMFIKHNIISDGEILRAVSFTDVTQENFELKCFFAYPNDPNINLDIAMVVGDSVFMQTNWYAPNGRILLANVNEVNKATEFITEYDVILESLNKFGKGKLVAMYSGNNFDVGLIFDYNGKLLKKTAFPEGKKVNGFYEKDDNRDYTFFSVSSFYHPPLKYQISLDDYSIEAIEKISVPYDAKSVETRYVEFASKDGTLIPMYITCLKDTKLNGNNPTLIYGYGGYGTTIEPRFNKQKILWVLHGGIYAVPNVRGGGAKGSSWSEAGRRLNKQNCFDDFIGATEYLINEKYTSPDKIAANGRSHGGLLVGVAITQRPDLYHAAVIEAGVLDALRFEKFTVGNANLNIQEFGTVRDSLDFFNLKSYSPLNNIKSGVKYPNVLLITGDSDDRVPPFHSYKFLATLQEKGDPKSKYQIYLEQGAGHYGTQIQDDWVEALIFKYYYLFDQLDLRFY